MVDLNNMKGCPWCEGPPELPLETDDACSPQKRVASVVECTNQTFGEDVPVAGTPYSLHYRSDRVPGRAAARQVIVPITDDTVSSQLRAIIVRLHVAGRHLEHRVECPCAAQDSVTMEWDGLDVFGRLTHGHQPAWLELAYEYAWASFSPAARGWAAVLRDMVARSGARRGRRAQHRGDPLAAISGPRPLGQRGGGARAVLLGRRAHLRSREPHLYRGDGSRRRGDAVTSTLEAIHFKAINDAVRGQLGAARRGRADDLASGLYRRAPDGTDEKLAPHVSDGCTAAFEIPALQSCYAKLLSDLALGPDGSLYATTDSGSRIVRIRPNGVVSRGGPRVGRRHRRRRARDLCPRQLPILAVASDSAVYCGGNSTIRRIGPEGTIRTVAGDRARSLATTSQRLRRGSGQSST
ncbi:MAG: hypothetical protein IPM79_35785 [Polyangiaceae bacterium]|nr:hypothetical protein [Polyangiaceae bacterium]